jgi:hypothetical protein
VIEALGAKNAKSCDRASNCKLPSNSTNIRPVTILRTALNGACLTYSIYIGLAMIDVVLVKLTEVVSHMRIQFEVRGTILQNRRPPKHFMLSTIRRFSPGSSAAELQRGGFLCPARRTSAIDFTALSTRI